MLAWKLEIEGLEGIDMTHAAARDVDMAHRFAFRKTIAQIKKDTVSDSADHLNIANKFLNKEVYSKASKNDGEVGIDVNSGISLIKLNPRQTSHGIRAANKKTYGQSFFAKRGTSRKPGVYMRRKGAKGKWNIKGNYVYFGAAVGYELDAFEEYQAFKIYRSLFIMKFEELSDV